MTKLTGILLVYAFVALVGLVLYVASFAIPIGGPILFYRGVLLAALTALVLGIAIFAVSRRVPIELATGLGAVLTSLAFNICFLVLLPVTVDRSISIFLLARIEAGERLTAADLQRQFETEYLGDMQQIPRRVEEQLISGNIQLENDGTITLTTRGRRFNTLAREAADWFGTDPRFVNAQPTE